MCVCVYHAMTYGAHRLVIYDERRPRRRRRTAPETPLVDDRASDHMEHQDFKEITIGRRAGGGGGSGAGSAKAAKDPKAVAAVRDVMRCDV